MLASNGITIKMYYRQKGQQMVREFIDYYRERLMQMWEKQDFEILPPIE